MYLFIKYLKYFIIFLIIKFRSVRFHWPSPQDGRKIYGFQKKNTKGIFNPTKPTFKPRKSRGEEMKYDPLRQVEPPS